MIASFFRAAKRLLTNLMSDLRYGGTFLGGTRKSRAADLGFYDTANSSYAALRQIFGGRVERGQRVVDVGAGKGRVINFLLSLDLDLEIIGIEVDPAVAAATHTRLQHYPDVRIVMGDARQCLPEAFDLLYMYNPFALPIMADFERKLRGRARKILYYNPLHLEPFMNDAWVVTVEARGTGALDHDLAVIVPAG